MADFIAYLLEFNYYYKPFQELNKIPLKKVALLDNLERIANNLWRKRRWSPPGLGINAGPNRSDANGS